MQKERDFYTDPDLNDIEEVSSPQRGKAKRKKGSVRMGRHLPSPRTSTSRDRVSKRKAKKSPVKRKRSIAKGPVSGRSASARRGVSAGRSSTASRFGRSGRAKRSA